MPYALWGIAYILLVSPYLLAGSSFEDKSSPVVGLSVPYDGSSTLVNRSISEAGLRKLKGLFLASVRCAAGRFLSIYVLFVFFYVLKDRLFVMFSSCCIEAQPWNRLNACWRL